MRYPLTRATQNGWHQRVPHQSISRRQSVRLHAIVRQIPANFEIHRMERMFHNLLCHCQKVRIVDEERFVQEREKTNRGKK
jgi:hypothetical protein